MEDVLCLDQFELFRIDQPNKFRNRDGRVIIYTQIIWCKSAQFVYNSVEKS